MATNPIDLLNLSDSAQNTQNTQATQTTQSTQNTQAPSANTPAKQPGKFAGVLGSAAKIAGNIFLPGLGGILGDAFGGLGVGALGSDPTQYLRLQQRINAETQAFESVSAVMKAKHEAAIDSIKNIQ